jgi:hypothetical protein
VSDERQDREFEVDEANRLLPTLTESLRKISDARKAIMRDAEPIRRNAPRNGGGREGKRYWEALRVMRRELEIIVGQGIILRDADEGLVDFPTRREGELVYLCWRMGEPEVAYWHRPDSGFAGRNLL